MPNRYELVVARSAARSIAEVLPESIGVAVIDLITGPLLESPHRVGKPLGRELAGLWSSRRGTYRVIYRIDETVSEVEVLRIDHRRDVYRS